MKPIQSSETPKQDTKHRYAPSRLACKGAACTVRSWRFYPAGTHQGPIVATMAAVEAVTDRGSRWYGCERAYINGELRFVVIGFDARDEVRRNWPIVPSGLRVPTPETTLDAFTLAYIEAALWSSTDNGYLGKDDPRNDKRGEETGGDPLDQNFGAEDIAPETMAKMVADCARFQAENAAEIAMGVDGMSRNGEPYTAVERAGHDFWLTRCGHGAGFGDGDWPEPADSRLYKAAEAYGNVDLYVGDDGQVWS